MKKQDDTLTPQRKHRKLLKDGSGTEVWPESIEKTFVQGLREYWGSPYATYSQSRGRSRWRNQFLVDYLQRHGIHRTKKQVASHIQVLRNMWKGQSEFHLVAGGDEAVDPVTNEPIKEEQWDGNGLIPFDWDDDSSSHSASPDFSPPDSQSDFPLTPEQRPNLYPVDTGVYPPKHHSSPAHMSSIGQSSPAEIASPSISPYGTYQQQLPIREIDRITSRKHISEPLQNTHAFQNQPYPRYALNNRVSTLFLCADGMTPFSVNVDALGQSTSTTRPIFTLRIKLSVPMMNDVRSPSALHGFTASIVVANVWTSVSKCTTKVYASNVCISEETGILEVSHINNAGAVHAVLPESSMSRCRWLDPNTTSTLTQEIAVDDQVLLYLIYDLDRRNGPMPSAEFLGFQHYRPTEKASSTTMNATTQYGVPAARRVSQPSLAYALTSNRYPTTLPTMSR